MHRRLPTLIAGMLLAGVPAAAHHSFSAYYFEEQSVTITGAVQEFVYRSPHAIVMVNAPDADGRTRTYAAEFASPNRLAREGITKDTLKPGDQVVVTGSPGRTASEYKIHLKSIQRPSDGWSWGGGRRRR
ncbi:MAG: hypothetical protein FJW14_13825 [Acidimicrobiia bacterium]|nr:hypothetical protein [Acidimicrobiia bacterium]